MIYRVRHRRIVIGSLLAIALLLSGRQLSAGQPPQDAPSFRLEVMPTLSKAGCNLGTCHANQNGKGGFRLSLRGQDPEFDYRQLTRQYAGRRIDPLSPADSLILLKATTAIPHVGGKRFDRDSEHYRTLHAWITAGAPGSKDDEKTLVRLEVEGVESGGLTIIEAPRDRVKLRVTAHFDDDSQRDVTRLAVYELSNLLAEASPDGVITRRKFGETTVIVRFLQLQQPVRLAFIPAAGDFAWNAPQPANKIDEIAFAKLRRLKMNPSEVCDDYVFLRRAYFDLLGVPPTANEARAFVADDDPNKRSRLIDDLLMRPEYASHWALKWSDMLRNEEKVLDVRGVEVFHDWIRDSFAEGKPLNQFVSEIIAARGSTYDVPPANFWRANRDAVTRAESTARVFLGIRLQCAKCHNHPFDRWTQDDYYNWATVFSRVEYEEVTKNKRRDKFDKNEFVGEQLVKLTDSGEVKNARTGKNAQPRFLGADPLEVDSKADRLQPLADWLTSPENDLFARVQANYLWKQVMGTGLVEPIDDFRHTNPASNPELLDFLTSELVNSGFDQRHLLRQIMNSRLYQLSSLPNDSNGHDRLNYSHAIVRRRTAEQLLDAQCQVLGVAADFAGYDRGMRAGEIPGVRKVRPRDGSPGTGDRFLTMFGKPPRIVACDCERTNETTLNQAFVLIGGEGLHRRLTAKENRLRKLADSDISPADTARELYWCALSREPSDEELVAAVEVIEEDRLAGLQDLAWALLNAKEFLFRE